MKLITQHSINYSAWITTFYDEITRQRMIPDIKFDSGDCNTVHIEKHNSRNCVCASSGNPDLNGCKANKCMDCVLKCVFISLHEQA